MEILFLIINSLYLALTFILFFGWLRTPTFHSKKHTIFQTKVSVIIAVRNEEENISALLSDLIKQTYPENLFEIIIIDDHSSDQTAEIVQNFSQKAKLSVRLIELKNMILNELKENNYKKKAIEYGVSIANGELIITTDGDCRLNEKWIETFVVFYEENHAKCISGAVTFSENDSFFGKIQTVEFASLIASGASTLFYRFPTMCNGANMAYQKTTFEEVNGYENSSKTASGDDIFLLQKIHQKYPNHVFFLKGADSIVSTKPQPDLNSFYNQRIRWASKWNLYKDFKVSLLAFFVFLANISLFVSIVYGFYHPESRNMLFLQIICRFSVEFVFLSAVLFFLKKTKLVLFIPVVQFFYFFYVSFFGLTASIKKNYTWKERKIKA